VIRATRTRLLLTAALWVRPPLLGFAIVAAVGAGLNAGVGKGLLSWRLNAVRRRQPRKSAPPRRQLVAMIPGGLR
jgi:hypothetical protein